MFVKLDPRRNSSRRSFDSILPHFLAKTTSRECFNSQHTAELALHDIQGGSFPHSSCANHLVTTVKSNECLNSVANTMRIEGGDRSVVSSGVVDNSAFHDFHESTASSVEDVIFLQQEEHLPGRSRSSLTMNSRLDDALDLDLAIRSTSPVWNDNDVNKVDDDEEEDDDCDSLWFTNLASCDERDSENMHVEVSLKIEIHTSGFRLLD